MCEECERAETLAAVYVRKANRYGWRPPAQAASVPRHADTTAVEPRPMRSVVCAKVGEMNAATTE